LSFPFFAINVNDHWLGSDSVFLIYRHRRYSALMGWGRDPGQKPNKDPISRTIPWIEFNEHTHTYAHYLSSELLNIDSHEPSVTQARRFGQ
jgi:hypothetical protein